MLVQQLFVQNLLRLLALFREARAPVDAWRVGGTHGEGNAVVAAARAADARTLRRLLSERAGAGGGGGGGAGGGGEERKAGVEERGAGNETGRTG